jgi:tRNA 2-selenouridine synthase
MKIADFLSSPGVCFDVRSPQEYAHAHIPGAVNFPLFSDDERAQVGTVYKREGQERAIRLGVTLVGPKLPLLMHQAESHIEKEVKTYCWRGGMRSGFVSFFLRFLGYSVQQLEGGYKAFRRAVQNHFSQVYRFCVIGGLTGCGKTEILQELHLLGEQTIDLEALAHHRGSAYGAIEGKEQPSQEQFENRLGMALSGKACPLWLEDESRVIGQCVIPKNIYHSMQKAPLFIISAPIEDRLSRICRLYGQYSEKQLVEATLKIEKKLGGVVAKEVISKIEAGRLEEAVERLLQYYDRAYALSMSRHSGPIIQLPLHSHTPKEWANILKETHESK